MTGTIVHGSNNIFTVRIGEFRRGEERQCRLKGKTLHGIEEYNALAPGDLVELDSSEELVIARLPRRNSVWRWNGKRNQPQTLAANVDSVIAICCSGSPPFRPRFVDRVGVIAESEDIPFVVVYNKAESDPEPEIERRLAWYEALGYEVLRTSAVTGTGLEGLATRLRGSTAAFVGHSGVGKSSLVNRLIRGAHQAVGELSQKHDRGRHTTSSGLLLSDGELTIVDTPGIREIDLYPLTELEISAAFPELRAREAACRHSGCSHIHEPGCAVQDAIDTGEIHPDRYESYLRAVHARNETERRLRVYQR